MNCKKGEMALIIKGSSNEGKIVSCLEFIGNTIPGFPPPGKRFNDIWKVDRKLNITYRGKLFSLPYYFDRYMKPLRDSPDLDETLIYIGSTKHLPIKVTNSI